MLQPNSDATPHIHGLRELFPSERDFHPSLIQLVERPPSPLPRAILHVLLLLVVCAGVWAALGRLEIITSAQGRLVPRTFVKIVQPAQTGRIAEIQVDDGDVVQAGQVLMRMDDMATGVDLSKLKTEMSMQRLLLARIRAELDGEAFPARRDEPAELYAQVRVELDANLAAYESQRNRYAAALLKAREELAAALAVQARMTDSLPLLEEREDALKQLEGKGFAAKLEVTEMRRLRQEHAQNLKAQGAEIARLKAAVSETEHGLAAFKSGYAAELQTQRVKAVSDLDKLTQLWALQNHQNILQTIVAPQRGIIKELITHTPGAVVQQGTILARLVPLDEPLQAEVWVKNDDAGGVRVGQSARVKVQAFPFQKHGLLDAEVVHVDADASSVGGVTPGSDREPPQSDLAYRVLVRFVAQTRPDAAGLLPKLAAGMKVTAELKDGERSVLDYLLAPIQVAVAEAGRER